MIQRPNYCRQILRQGVDGVRSSAISSAQKFILPPGGVLLDDKSLRAIDETMELRLPFPVVALEYEFTDSNGRSFGDVLVAVEGEGRITAFTFVKINGKWEDFSTFFWMPSTGYMDRSVAGYRGFPGLVSYENFGGEERKLDLVENYCWQRVLLSFVNALACSNVRTEVIKPKKADRKVKSALPFDTYHVLAIDAPIGKTWDGIGNIGGLHRSPREHLRRGHIRRCESGLKVWVNATVVNPGVGGMVSKDYVMSGISA